MSYHEVLVGYHNRTLDDDKWCLLGGAVFTLATDVYDAYRYALRGVLGGRRQQKCVGSRVVADAQGVGSQQVCFRVDKELLMKRLQSDHRFNVTKITAVGARWNKKKKQSETIAKMNAAKKTNELWLTNKQVNALL
jgi:hypothetical protein